MAVVAVKILGRCQATERSYTVFRIQVQLGEKSSVVERRYSEFAALDRQLRPNMPSLPVLPPKSVVKGFSFMYHREYALGQLLLGMVSLDPQLQNPALRSFLSVSEADLAE